MGPEAGVGPENSALPGLAPEKGQLGEPKTRQLTSGPLPPFCFFSPGTTHPHTWFSFLRVESQCRNAPCAIIPLPPSLAASSQALRGGGPTTLTAMLPPFCLHSVSRAGLCCPRAPPPGLRPVQDLKTVPSTRTGTLSHKGLGVGPQNLKSILEKI